MNFVNGINLAFHEGGHMIFGILGITFITVLGGTLMQLALPAAAAVHFLKRSHCVALMSLNKGKKELLSLSQEMVRAM